MPKYRQFLFQNQDHYNVNPAIHAQNLACNNHVGIGTRNDCPSRQVSAVVYGLGQEPV